MDPAVAKEMNGTADVDWSEQSAANNLLDADRDFAVAKPQQGQQTIHADSCVDVNRVVSDGHRKINNLTS